MTARNPNKPPDHLSGRSKRLWAAVLADYELEATALETLRVGLEALDRMDELRLEINRDGAVVHDRYGVPKAHPAIQAEHICRADWLRCCRELALDGPAGGAAGELARPPTIRGRYDVA